jgi:hypothetical protein
VFSPSDQPYEAPACAAPSVVVACTAVGCPGVRLDGVAVSANPDWQVTAIVCVAAHDASGSPSLTVSVIVAVPGAVQVKVGFVTVALLSVPSEVVQL